MKAYRSLFVCLALLTGLAAINFFFGVVEDDDGSKIIRKALTQRWYAQSRTWGFPAYEIPIYPVLYYAGFIAAKLYSLLFALGSVVLLWLILRHAVNDQSKITLGLLAYVVMPVTIISANSLMETSQAIFFVLLGLFFYLRFERHGRHSEFYLMCLALGLATSTRPDHIIVSGCVALTVLILKRPSLKTILLGTVIWGVAALLPFAIYAESRVQLGLILPEALGRKVARAVLGYLAMFGLPACLVLLGWVASHWRKLDKAPAHLWVLSGLIVVLYSVRYVLLPDELEYVQIVALVLILMLITLGMSRRFLVALVIALFIPNLVQLHFFTRDEMGALQTSVGISPGVFVQEREKRLLREYLDGEFEGQLQQVAASYGFTSYHRDPEGREVGILVIMPLEGMRYYQPDRLDGRYFRAACQQTIVTYPIPFDRAWRQFIAFKPWSKVEISEFTRVDFPHCS